MYFVTLKKLNKCGAEIVVFWKDQRLRNMPSLNLLVKMIMYLHYRQQENQDYRNDFIFYSPPRRPVCLRTVSILKRKSNIML